MKLALMIIATLAALEGASRADSQTSAESLYTEGQTDYDKEDYAGAIAKWQESYQLSSESGLLFNLAQARRLSGDCAQALTTYKKFVATDPDPTSEQHKLALDFARELEPTCGSHASIDNQRPNPQPAVGGGLNDREDRDTDRTLRIEGLVTSGAGAVSLAIGLGLGHLASTSGDEVTSACAVSCDWTVQKSKDAAGRRDATIGYALDAVGVAAIAGGAVMYYLGNRSAVTVAPRTEGGAVASWSGSW